MASLRQGRPSELAGLRVVKVADYQESVQEDVVSGARSPIDLPKSNVLAFGLEGGAGLVIRPSGTEPKVKAYVTATGADPDAAEAMAEPAPGSGGRPAQGISSRIAEARVAGGPYALLLLAPADRGQRLYSRIP